MTDSPRYCDRCGGYGDHHTDKHPDTLPVFEVKVKMTEEVTYRVTAPNENVAFSIVQGGEDELSYEDVEDGMWIREVDREPLDDEIEWPEPVSS